MEDQGKRLMLAVGIAFAIMMVWSIVFPPEKPKKDESKDKDKAAETAAGDKASEGTEPSAETAPAPTPVDRGEEVFFDFDFDKVHARFSNYGGSLVSWELKGKRLEDRKNKAPEDLIRVDKDEFRTLELWFDESTFDIPRGSEWIGKKTSETELEFIWQSSDMVVVKTIKIHPDDYMLEMGVSVELAGAASAKQSLALSLYSFQKPGVSDGGMMDRVSRKWKSACYYDDELKTKSAKSLRKKGPKERSGEILWGGFDHAYFLVAAAFKGGKDQDSKCKASALRGLEGGMGVDLVQMPVEIKKGEPGIKSQVAMYLGPKYQDKVEDAGKVVGFNPHFEGSIDLGFLAIIAGPLLSLLKFFQSFVINWGIAIFLLTLVVKGLTLPWTHKSMMSMKAMAKLKPELEKIKEKYPEDRQRQNVETMNLFKAHKVNPMSGCLPMLLQMPIWFALYRSLTVAAELYQAPFIPGWIDDLTLPDPYHVMPVLLMGLMFLQTRLTPSTGTGAQQKILMYGMPLMFGFFSFFFPAGLTLYIITNTCFTALHHVYMNAKDTSPSASGGGASGGKDVAEIAKKASDAKVSSKTEDAESESSEGSSGSKTGAAKKPSANKGGSKKKGKGKKKGRR